MPQQVSTLLLKKSSVVYKKCGLKLFSVNDTIQLSSVPFGFIDIAPNHNSSCFKLFMLYSKDPTIIQPNNNTENYNIR